MKTRLLSIIGLVAILPIIVLTVNLAYAESHPHSYSSFIQDDFFMSTDGTRVDRIHLNWDSKDLTGGRVNFNEPFTGTLEIQIPKSIPRLMNTDFETSFFLEFYDNEKHDDTVIETESKCYYILSMNLENIEYFKIITASVGNWEPVSTLNQECRDFTLKQQVDNNIPTDKILCSNAEHTLVERPNGKLACIYNSSMWEVNWLKIIGGHNPFSTFTQNFLKDDKLHTVKYEIFGGVIQKISFDDSIQYMTIDIAPTQNGILTISLPRDLLDSIMDYCPPKLENPPDDIFFVLLNQVEGSYDEVFKNDTVRTLQIPFFDDTRQIEIIGTCYI